MADTLYADIILPLSFGDSLTYVVDKKLLSSISVGCRVIVQLGKTKEYTGIVKSLHNDIPDYKNIKTVSKLVDTRPFISPGQIKLWQWISEYYFCTPGEVMNAAIPSVFLSNDNKSYHKRIETFVILKKDYNETEINNILEGLEKTPARYRILLKWIELSLFCEQGKTIAVSKSNLLKSAKTNSASLGKLIEKGIFELVNKEISRFGHVCAGTNSFTLSEVQLSAWNSIVSQFNQKDVVLLHGVTSSGKTEIYIHLIEKYLKNKQKVLYLLPEIALTSQIINRLRGHFGNRVGIYHSGLREAEKAEVYCRLQGNSDLEEYDILLGVRSSVFLPINDLGLIIIDEEHDSSYKQHDPAPRYNARDTAIMRAHNVGAKVLLGSATPSVETRYNSQTGKYGYVRVNERYGKINMPEIILSDSKEAWRKKMMISHFTPQMINAIESALSRKEQIVLFRNRRGFAHFLLCADCGWTPVCPNCSVNYTYHKSLNKMYCHYCGSSVSMPDSCGNCESTNMRMRGYGTEKIEDEISILFPDAIIARMDFDSTRRRGSLEKIIRELENKKTDILIGTQMISKGLDFENLTVVGIMNIDNMLFYPDFRAHERCFQLAAQVSGRAGRRKTRGQVLIQTSDPYHPVMKQIFNNDYDGMYKTQIEERKEFNYPPFCRLIRIFLKHKDQQPLDRAAAAMTRNLKLSLGESVLGPEIPPLHRIQKLYIRSVLLKIDKTKSIAFIRELIRRNINSIQKEKEFSGIRIYSDVDPQ